VYECESNKLHSTLVLIFEYMDLELIQRKLSEP
jgi:hypothetical protein